MKEILVILLTAVLTQNFVFIKFMGICPFLGVSDKTDKAVGMSFAVIFVMTLSSAATWCVYHYVLIPYGLEYLKTVAFILIIASLVQLIEMFLKKFIPALYASLGVYLPLITTNCAFLGVGLIMIQPEY
jgi:electron transport complex protein RnfA